MLTLYPPTAGSQRCLKASLEDCLHGSLLPDAMLCQPPAGPAEPAGGLSALNMFSMLGFCWLLMPCFGANLART